MWYSSLDKQICCQVGTRDYNNTANAEVAKVYLCEVLEVRRKPLREPELWSVLCMSIEAIQDLFLQDDDTHHSITKLVINPNTLAFTFQGRVCFTKCNLFDEVETSIYSPPELHTDKDVNEDYIEKILIYSLGKTLLHAATFTQDNEKTTNEISLLLKTTLDAMCEIDVKARSNILSILELISHEAHNFTQEKPFTYFVSNLHREVLGCNINHDYYLKEESKTSSTKEDSSPQRCIRDSNYTQKLNEPPFSDAYGKRLGYCPRMPIKRSLRDRWKTAATRLISNKIIPPEDSTINCNFKNETKLNQILQLDVNISDLENIPFKDKIGNKCPNSNFAQDAINKTTKLKELRTIISVNDEKSSENVPNVHVPSRSFRSTIYDLINYPSLKRVQRNSTIRKPKSEVGPEFVLMSCKPNELFEMEKTKTRNNKHLKHLVVVLINGQRLETKCDTSVTKVQHLWDSVVKHQKLKRKFLFGLAYIKDGEFIFMESDMKLDKVSPPIWLERRGKNKHDVNSFTIYVRIKYYLSINVIRDKSFRHTLYLQLRRDILEERTQCDPQKCVFLGSLALQAEFETYDESVFGNDYFNLDHYLSPSAIDYFGPENATKELIAAHTDRHSMSQILCENEFIKEVQSLPEYGFHFNYVQQGKKEKNLKSTVIGINSSGISLFNVVEKRRVFIKSFEWKRIQQMRYDDKHFYLTIIPETSYGTSEKLKFFTGKEKSQYLYHMASSHHRLHLMLDCHIKIPDMSLDDSLELKENENDMNEHEQSYNLKQNFKHNEKDNQTAYVIGTSFGGQSPSGICDDSLNESLVNRFNNLDCTNSGERRLVSVSLLKSNLFGFGLSVTPGVDNGIYIQEIFPGSPAYTCGKLRQGDRIFSVNRTLVDCMEYQDALDLIRNSGEKLDIVVSQQILNYDLSPITEEIDLSSKIESVLPQCEKAVKIISQQSQSKMIHSKPIRRRLSSCSRRLNHDNRIREKPKSLEIIPISHEDYENVHAENGCGLRLDSSKCNLDQCEIFKYEKFVSSKFGHRLSKNLKLSSSTTNLQSENTSLKKLRAGRSLSENDVWNSRECSSSLVRQDSTEILRSESIDNEEIVFNVDNNLWLEQEICEKADLENRKEFSASIKKGDIYHVVLEKLHGSFGINIKGGVNSSVTEENILVQQVLRGGAADLDGRVKVGDVILEVNGTNLSGASHQEAVNALRTSSPLAHLTLRRGQASTSVRFRNTTPLFTPSVRLNNVPEENNVMGTSSTSFAHPDVNIGIGCTIERNGPIKNTTWAPTVNQPNPAGWRLVHSVVNPAISRDKTVPAVHNAPEGHSYTTTIRVNPEADIPLRLRRNSDDCQRTKVNFTNEAPNVIRLKVNFGEYPTSGALRRSLSTDSTGNNVRRRSSLEWIPSVNSLRFSDQVGNLLAQESSTSAFKCETGVSKEEHVRVIGSTANRKLLSQKERFAIDKHVNGNLLESGPSIGVRPDFLSQRSSSVMTNVGDTLEKETRETMPKTTLSAESIVSNVNKECEKITCDQNTWWLRNANEDIDDSVNDEEQVSLLELYPFIKEENTFRVELEKNSRGIGLSVCGGCDSNSDDPIARLIRIKRLYPLQPAAECGKLDIGDVVLAVNNQPLLGLMYFEAIEILRMATNPIVLTVCRPASGVLPPIPQTSSLLATALMGTLLDESDGNVARYTGPTYTEFDVTLTKIGGSLGFTLVKLDGPNGGHYVKALVKEPALTDGSLQPGDRIILVNGTDISEMDHSESIKFLRELPDEVTLCVWRQVVPPSSPNSPTTNEDVEKKFKPKPLLRKEALDMLNDKSRPKGCRKNLNGGSPLASPRIRRKQLRECDAQQDADQHNENGKRRISSNVSSTGSTTESSSSGIDKGTSSSERSFSSPIAISQTSDLATASPESPGKPQRPSYLDLTSEHLSPRKQMFGRAPHQSAAREDDGADSEEFSYIRYLDSGDSLLASDDGLTTVTSSEGSPVHTMGQSALLKWRGAKLASQEDLDTDKCNQPPRPDPSRERRQTLTVEVEREGSARLGLTLHNMDTNEATGIYIKVVYPGSLAAMDGRLQVGDKILQINETSVSGMTVERAIDLLRKQNGKLVIVVERLTDNVAKQSLLRELADEFGSVSSVPSSLTRSQSEQEEMLSNEVSMLNAKNNNLSSVDCLHWSDRSQNENDNVDNRPIPNIDT